MDKLEDNKFAHLLQPIRDLAANWDINIANELEDYLVRVKSPAKARTQQVTSLMHVSVQDVLENVTFSFEGGPNLNFAEGLQHFALIPCMC